MLVQYNKNCKRNIEIMTKFICRSQVLNTIELEFMYLALFKDIQALSIGKAQLLTCLLQNIA